MTEKPGAGIVMELSRDFQRSQVLFSAVELDLFDALAAGPKTPTEIAKKLRLNLRGTDCLMHALASIELLEKKGGRFRLSPVAEKHLVSGRPGYMGNIVRHSANLQPIWAQLANVVRTGKPADRLRKPETEEGKSALRNFILGMADLAAPMARELWGLLDLSGVSRMLDVGGGPGTYTFELIRKKSDIECAVFDSPIVIPITIEQIELNGMRAKVGTIQGDFNKDGLGSGFDLVLMSNILHSNSPRECGALIKKGFRALNPGGRLVIVEFALNRERTGPPSGSLFSVNMLVGTPGGAAFAAEEMAAWMKAAGFRVADRFPLMERSVVLVGKKSAKAGAKKKA